MLLKKFDMNRMCGIEMRQKRAKKLGWKLYATSNMQNRARKKFPVDDSEIHVDVCFRAMGRFMAYDRNKPADHSFLASEATTQYEDERWYQEILFLIFEDMNLEARHG